MARYSRIFSTIWSDADFVALSAAAQRLYFVLASHPDGAHGRVPGDVDRLAGMAADTSPIRVLAAIDELHCAGFIERGPDHLTVTRHFLRPPTDTGRKKRHGRIDGLTLAARLIKSGRTPRDCAYCGVAFGALTPTVDHCVPLSRGGTNDLDNLVWACLPCNLRKGTKTAEEFAS